MRTCQAATVGAVVLSFHYRRRTVSSALVLLVVGVLAGLAPVAHANPPDPTWIAGFYDDADFDDVVLAIVSAAVAASPSAQAAAVPQACGDCLPEARPIVRDHRPRLPANRSPPLPPA